MIDYNIYNPNGNITVLVNSFVEKEKRPAVALDIMQKETNAEQVGYVSTDVDFCDIRLDMAGGEFCGNATLCAGVYCYEKYGKNKDIKVSVSGCGEILNVNVQKNENGYSACTNMPVPVSYEIKNLSVSGENYKVPVVDLGGISHCVIDFGMSSDIAEVAVKKWCGELNRNALGIMLFNEKTMSVVPIVYVPDADTLFFENSCASGTTAVGYYLCKKDNREVCKDIFQPGGVLNVKAKPDGTLYLTGSVERMK